MSSARTALIAMAAALCLAGAAPVAGPRIDPALLHQVTQTAEAVIHQDASAAEKIDALREVRWDRPADVLIQIAIYLSQSTGTEQSMAGAMVLHEMRFKPEQMLSAIVPFLDAAAPPLRRVLTEMMGSLDRTEGGEPDFSVYEPWMKTHARAAGLVHYLYDVSPEAAVRSLQNVYGAGRPLRPATSERMAAAGGEPDKARAGLEALAAEPDWWVRLYAATLLQKRPELGSPGIAEKLGHDADPLVRGALATPAPHQ